MNLAQILVQNKNENLISWIVSRAPNSENHQEVILYILEKLSEQLNIEYGKTDEIDIWSVCVGYYNLIEEREKERRKQLQEKGVAPSPRQFPPFKDEYAAWLKAWSTLKEKEAGPDFSGRAVAQKIVIRMEPKTEIVGAMKSMGFLSQNPQNDKNSSSNNKKTVCLPNTHLAPLLRQIILGAISTYSQNMGYDSQPSLFASFAAIVSVGTESSNREKYAIRKLNVALMNLRGADLTVKTLLIKLGKFLALYDDADVSKPKKTSLAKCLVAALVALEKKTAKAMEGAINKAITTSSDGFHLNLSHFSVDSDQRNITPLEFGKALKNLSEIEENQFVIL